MTGGTIVAVVKSKNAANIIVKYLFFIFMFKSEDITRNKSNICIALLLSVGLLDIERITKYKELFKNKDIARLFARNKSNIFVALGHCVIGNNAVGFVKYLILNIKI